MAASNYQQSKLECKDSVMMQLTQTPKHACCEMVSHLCEIIPHLKIVINATMTRKTWLLSSRADALVCVGWPCSHRYMVTILNYHLVGATNYSVLSYF